MQTKTNSLKYLRGEKQIEERDRTKGNWKKLTDRIEADKIKGKIIGVMHDKRCQVYHCRKFGKVYLIQNRSKSVLICHDCKEKSQVV